ncbi:MAG: REP-associated tyrosine transposase [Vicinamibacteria bacterium]|jgi:REP element-mobilizing transposase RayT
MLAGRWSERDRIYLATTRTFQRRPLFREFLAAASLAKELHELERAGGVHLLAWVVMPDHLHLIAQLLDMSLPNVMRRLKGRSSRAIGMLGRASGPVWQHGYHERAVRREEDVRSLARYVCANPVRAGLVRSVRDYPFWDACWLEE